MLPGEAHALVSLLAAAVGIKVEISKAAVGAEGLLLRAGGSLQAAARRVCRTGAIARPSLAWRPRGAAQEQLWGARQRFAGWRRAWQA